MTSKTDIVKPKTVKVYELDNFEKLLNGLKVAACMLTESHQIVDEESVIKRLNALTLGGVSDTTCCSCCGVGPFVSRAEQTAHYKDHWHTHNLKRKLFGKPPVTYGQFNSRQDDDSSVSGSDSETEGNPSDPGSELFAAATRHCKAFFTNQYGQVFCIYRCILHNRKEDLSTDGEGRAWTDRCRRAAAPGAQRWAVLMASGGHFAGAVFAGGAAVRHKTLHSYVTRRGQGQAQATRDQHSTAPKSAGASLRRYNQAQFLEHIQEILASWADDLAICSLVLYRAVGSTNQAAIFGKGSPIKRDDPRTRALPFPTRKPTYKEVQRAHETVASVEVYDTMELFQKALMASTAYKSIMKTDPNVANKKAQKTSPNKLDRAKSRERAPRELPTQIVSSEDEGPCFIDSETPANWIKTLSEQQSNGVITNSRKDLINEINDCSIASSEASDTESENVPERREKKAKKKKKKQEDKKQEDKKREDKKQEDKKQEDKKQEDKKREDNKLEDKKQEDKKHDDINRNVKKLPQKIPASVKKMWKLIAGEDITLEPVLEAWEGEELCAACNTADPADGNTALHKAAIFAKTDMVTQILTAGGDPCIRNHALQTPYAASPHNDTRIAFRLFQAQHPDKYNYAKSHIPGPLTPELLEQEKEKKAQQKKAKRQRDKEKQTEKIKSNKFLQLTDAEKIKAPESRCFLCGSALPKAPFEYARFRFCSIRCLQNHRNVRPLNISAC